MTGLRGLDEPLTHSGACLEMNRRTRFLSAADGRGERRTRSRQQSVNVPGGLRRRDGQGLAVDGMSGVRVGGGTCTISYYYWSLAPELLRTRRYSTLSEAVPRRAGSAVPTRPRSATRRGKHFFHYRPCGLSPGLTAGDTCLSRQNSRHGDLWRLTRSGRSCSDHPVC